LAFFAKNLQLSDVMLMGKQQPPHSSHRFCSGHSVVNKPNPNSQWLASRTTMITSHEADETGESVTPGKKHCSMVRVDGKVRSGGNGSKCGTR